MLSDASVTPPCASLLNGSARETSAAEESPSEAAAIAAALAHKLGCVQIALIALTPEDLGPLVREIRTVVVDDLTKLADDVDRTLIVAAAEWVLTREGSQAMLAHALDSAPAAVVVDATGGVGLGRVALLSAVLEAADVHVVHRSLIVPHGSRRRDAPLIVACRKHAHTVTPLLAAGVRSLALDPAIDLSARLERPARVCVASYEVMGPTRNGGIGTANTSLAHALGRAGHDVTLLFTGNAASSDPTATETWRARHARESVRFETLGKPFAPSVSVPHYNARRAYELYLWLLDTETRPPFDVVHFPDCQGHGYYAVLAKHLGLAFAETLFVAGVHSSTRWCAEANRELPLSIDALVDEHLEVRSVELADVVVSPSAYMFDYMLERGWKLPKRRFVQQYVLAPAARRGAGVADPLVPLQQPKELVFFGRLEIRKGVETFCDAIDRLAENGSPRNLRITFLGRPEHIAGEPASDYIARRARLWPFPYELLGELDHSDAISYLRTRNCVAVMPSTVDNSPNTVSETIGLGIPLVTSRSGGTGELIDPMDLERCTFPGLEPSSGQPPVPAGQILGEMSGHALAERLREALEQPRGAPSFSIDHQSNEQIHVAWHTGAVAATRRRRPARSRSADGCPPLPSVTVGVLHRDQPDAILRSLTALAGQQPELTDVVLIDNGSTSSLAAEAVDRAETIARQRGWKVVRQAEAHAARALGAIAGQGRGDLLLVLPAGASLLPGAVGKLRELASRDVADVLAWAALDETSEDGGTPKTVATLDGPPLIGLLYPAFACSGFAITRLALEALEGFAPDARGPEAVQDLLNRAVLAGLRLTAIPEPLAAIHAPDGWSELRGALSIDSAVLEDGREGRLVVARSFRGAQTDLVADLPGIYLSLVRKTVTERRESLSENRLLATERHRLAEYVAYLEDQHRLLTARVHSLEEALAGAWRWPRSTLGRLRRRFRG